MGKSSYIFENTNAIQWASNYSWGFKSFKRAQFVQAMVFKSAVVVREHQDGGKR